MLLGWSDDQFGYGCSVAEINVVLRIVCGSLLGPRYVDAAGEAAWYQRREAVLPWDGSGWKCYEFLECFQVLSRS